MEHLDSHSPSRLRGGAAFALAGLLLALAATPLKAQDAGQPAVSVNLDVLYSLDKGPIPGQSSGRAPLLPAPAAAPRSRLLVAPQPEPPLEAQTEAEPVAVAAPAPAPVATALETPAAAPPSPVEEPAAAPSADLPTPPAPPPAPELAAAPSPPPADNGAVQAPAAPDPAPQTAAVTPGPPLDLDEPLRLLFEPESASLDEADTQALNDLAARLRDAKGQRIQLLAYADAREGGDSVARRLSLSRALSVRSYLVSEGVPSSQIDVRALGAKYEEGPPDRVDILYVSR